ncbi:MAG: hypothetical protein ACYC49_01530 [Ignavibacteriaceae bacterium]
MNLNIKNHNPVYKSDLLEYIGKEIIILTHTSSKLEGSEFVWYKVPQKVKLLEYHDLENTIKIEKDGKIYEVILDTIDEIYSL